MGRDDALALNDWAVLGVLVEEERHGFAIARELDADGSLGRTWTVPRSLVYRALDHLLALELVAPVRTEDGDHGPRRTVMRPTARGRRALRTWLHTPVAHLRLVRSELMVKLTLLERAGEPVAELAHRQLETFRPAFAGLAEAARRTAGPDRITDLWRVESSRSVERFLRELAGDGVSPSPA
jgi:DNA-binding PadR family transcriptional regulator